LNVGDCVDFKVINELDFDTSVHFHGIRQLGTPWADGVPGISQKPILPGTEHVYSWVAEESGTYFYHAHYKGQMIDGLVGAIVIAPSDDEDLPYSQVDSDVASLKKAAANVETVLTSDWSQFTFQELFDIEKKANIDDACFDSITLNGFGSVYCKSIAELTANAAPQVPKILNGTSLTAKGCIPASNALIQGPQYQRNLAALPPQAYDVCTPYTGKDYTYKVDAADKWAAVSFVSSAGVALFKITIDSHKLYVYEINGNYVVPQVVDQISLTNGDRISCFVKLDQPAADYKIRVANLGINQVISGFGTLSYKGSKGPAAEVALQNYGGQNSTAIVGLNRGKAAPYPAVQVAATADKTFVLDIMKAPKQPTDAWAWTLSGVNAYNQTQDDNAIPLLFENPASIPDSDLILKTNYNEWVDLIIKVEGPVAQPHPIHKHANKFFAIGAGTGSFNYSSVAEAQAAGVKFNLQAPPYLDGFTSIPAEGGGSWMVFRYQANTPGAWLLHCHVQTHFSGGMAIAILDAVDMFPTIPDNYDQCGSGSNNGGQGGNGTGSGSGNGNGSWGSGNGSDSGSGSGSNGSGNGSWGSGSGSDSGSGSGSNGSGSNGSGSNGSGSTASGSSGWSSASSTGSPAGPATYTATGPSIATYTGAASTVQTSLLSVVFGLVAIAMAL
jgi:FtsP/CotA-like multicopper oxidase with cupredoxin domain